MLKLRLFRFCTNFDNLRLDLRRLGIPGTRGRECNRTSWGMDGCNLLCCGRGFRTEVLEVSEKCNCRFIYCCHVQCEQCNKTVMRHTCN